MEVCGQLHASVRFSLEQRVSLLTGHESLGAQIRSRLCTEESHLLDLLEIEPRYLVCPVRSI
jgi:hypothetical protein